MSIFLYNTLSKKKEEFVPIESGQIRMYCCGPTVYNYQHIGNMRSFIFEDLLKRMFLYNGYKVKHVMNITDVGHLTSDADEGDDKMEKGAAREGKSVWEIADFYTKEFLLDSERLNILNPAVTCKATDHINEQIELIKCLEAKGYTYIINEGREHGVYFDTSKARDYGKLAGLDIEGLQAGIRVELAEGKRNKTDFSLWKFSPTDKQRQMEWDSPWGKGAPGWHIECSAMSMKYLGNHFDIHCGGVDHIPIHHTNEIVQSEGCSGEKYVNYWLHGEFLLTGEEDKMSKSADNFLRVQTLIDKGYDPLDLRYLYLGTYYGKHLQFTWDSLNGAKSAHNRLKNKIFEFRKAGDGKLGNNEKVNFYKQEFKKDINDDLNIPAALGLMWEMIRDDSLSASDKLELVYEFDNVFGLNLKEAKEESGNDLPEEVNELVKQRSEAKKARDFKKADEIRAKAKELGWEIVDTKEGVKVKKA